MKENINDIVPINYDELPENIKKYMFYMHDHDKDGNIIYSEIDVLKIITYFLNKKD